jgi:cytidylate kinase
MDGSIGAPSEKRLRGETMRTTKLPERVDLSSMIHSRLRDQMKLGPCLLISRETGAGGSAIAQRVAQRLGWDLFDKQILDELATRYGTSREFLKAVDEKQVGWLTDILYGWLEGRGFSQLAYVHRLHLLFNRLAKQGNAVIVGRGARFVLPRQATFSVRIIASFDYRVRQLSLKQGYSLASAEHSIEQADREQKAFLKKYFHQDASDPHLHDMVVNVEQLGEENALTLIETGLKCWLEQFDIGTSNQRLSQSNALGVNHHW